MNIDINISEEKWLLLHEICTILLYKTSKLKGFSKHKSILKSLLERYYLGDRSLELYKLIKDYIYIFNQAISLRTKKEEKPKYNLYSNIINIYLPTAPTDL